MTDFLDALEQQLVGAARASAQEASPAGAGVRAGARAASPTSPAIARRRGHERALRRGIVPRRRWLLVLLPALLVLAVGGSRWAG